MDMDHMDMGHIGVALGSHGHGTWHMDMDMDMRPCKVTRVT
jgi:hypothetical protein